MDKKNNLLTQNEWEEVNEMIRIIHSTKNLNSMRIALLKKLMAIIGCCYIDFNLGLINRDSTPCLVDPVLVSIFGKTFEEDFQFQYESIYAPMDYLNWVFLCPESLVYRETDLIDDAVRKQSPFYREYLKVFGLVHIAGIVLASRGEFLGAVTLYKRDSQSDFSEKDLYILKQIMLHLQFRLDESTEKGKNEEMSKSYILRYKYLLSNREIEIMGLVLSGASNRAIGEVLEIKENTVKKHISNIFEKTQVNSRTQLCRFILNEGLENMWE